MLRRLRLLCFRCHRRLEFEPAPGRNWLVGPNGRGKTTILEAAFYLGRLRSFRTGQIREMAAWPGAGFAVEGERDEASDHSGMETLSVKWEKGARTTTIDGAAVPVEEFWGRLPAVLFSAEDGLLIRGPAARRQGWLDALRSASEVGHLVAVRRYNAVLKQRNAWLRQDALGGADAKLGEALSEQLLGEAARVTTGRLAAAAAAGRLAAPLLEAFFGGAGTCRFTYRPDLEPGAAVDWAKLAPQERRMQRTLVGPHRDEWEVRWNGKAVSRFGSEGEQRLAALLLRLIEAAALREARNGVWPLFLVDDALTPLDPERKLTLETLLPAEAQVLQAGTVPPASACLGPNDALWSLPAEGIVREH